MNASLGYNAEDRREAPDLWGFGDDHKSVWLPAGSQSRGPRAARVAREYPPARGIPKYVAAAGSANALYRVDTLAPGFGAVLVEGEFDALTIWQHAGGIISSVATGSTSGARRPHWLTRLASCGVVLAAFDDDEAGEEAAAYWLDVLPNARRWRPYYGKDANGLATGGGNVAAGSGWAGQCAVVMTNHSRLKIGRLLLHAVQVEPPDSWCDGNTRSTQMRHLPSTLSGRSDRPVAPAANSHGCPCRLGRGLAAARGAQAPQVLAGVGQSGQEGHGTRARRAGRSRGRAQRHDGVPGDQVALPPDILDFHRTGRADRRARAEADAGLGLDVERRALSRPAPRPVKRDCRRAHQVTAHAYAQPAQDAQLTPAARAAGRAAAAGAATGAAVGAIEARRGQAGVRGQVADYAGRRAARQQEFQHHPTNGHRPARLRPHLGGPRPRECVHAATTCGREERLRRHLHHAEPARAVGRQSLPVAQGRQMRAGQAHRLQHRGAGRGRSPCERRSHRRWSTWACGQLLTPAPCGTCLRGSGARRHAPHTRPENNGGSRAPDWVRSGPGRRASRPSRPRPPLRAAQVTHAALPVRDAGKDLLQVGAYPRGQAVHLPHDSARVKSRK